MSSSSAKAYKEKLKADQAKAEQPKADQAKAEQPKADQAKAEQAKADQAKAEQAKAEQAKAEQAKADKAKAEQAKADKAKAEQAKADPKCKAEQATKDNTKAKAENEAKDKANKKPNQDLLAKLEMIKKYAAAIQDHKALHDKSLKLSDDLNGLSNELGRLNEELGRGATPSRISTIETRKIEIANKKSLLHKDTVIVKNQKEKINKEFKFTDQYDSHELFKSGGLKSIFHSYEAICNKGKGFISSKLSACDHRVQDTINELEKCKTTEKTDTAKCDKMEDNPDCTQKINANSFSYSADCISVTNAKLSECSKPDVDIDKIETPKKPEVISKCIAEAQSDHYKCRIKSCKDEKSQCSMKAKTAKKICSDGALKESFGNSLYTTDCDLIKIQNCNLWGNCHTDLSKTQDAQQACKPNAWVDITQIDGLISTLSSTTTDYDSF